MTTKLRRLASREKRRSFARRQQVQLIEIEDRIFCGEKRARQYADRNKPRLTEGVIPPLPVKTEEKAA